MRTILLMLCLSITPAMADDLSATASGLTLFSTCQQLMDYTATHHHVSQETITENGKFMLSVVYASSPDIPRALLVEPANVRNLVSAFGRRCAYDPSLRVNDAMSSAAHAVVRQPTSVVQGDPAVIWGPVILLLIVFAALCLTFDHVGRVWKKKWQDQHRYPDQDA